MTRWRKRRVRGGSRQQTLAPSAGTSARNGPRAQRRRGERRRTRRENSLLNRGEPIQGGCDSIRQVATIMQGVCRCARGR